MADDFLLSLQAILIGFGIWALFLVVHVVWWRMSQRKGLKILLSLIVIVWAFTTILFCLLEVPSLAIVCAIPVTLFAVLAYLHLYVGTYRSLSVRILSELAQAEGSMTTEELNQVYPLVFMYRSRIDLLQQNGWIHRTAGNGYACSPKGTFFAAIIISLRSLYGVTHAG